MAAEQVSHSIILTNCKTLIGAVDRGRADRGEKEKKPKKAGGGGKAGKPRQSR